MARLDQERQKELAPKRMTFAKCELQKIGIELTFESDTELRFIHKNHEVKFFPYTGWHTGKTIKDGRGINELMKQLKNQEK